MDRRFKAEHLEDKEGALEELTSEAAAVVDKKKPPTREDEEESPLHLKKLWGLQLSWKKFLEGNLLNLLLINKRRKRSYLMVTCHYRI